jgi:hypothetical protein
MDYSQVVTGVYQHQTEGFGATMYTQTCDIVELVQTSDSGGLTITTPNVIQAGVKCRIVATKQETVNADVSSTKERVYTLYLQNTVQLKDDYVYTNFSDPALTEPQKYYKPVKSVEKFLIASGNGGYIYHIKGVKRIDKDG